MYHTSIRHFRSFTKDFTEQYVKAPKIYWPQPGIGTGLLLKKNLARGNLHIPPCMMNIIDGSFTNDVCTYSFAKYRKLYLLKSQRRMNGFVTCQRTSRRKKHRSLNYFHFARWLKAVLVIKFTIVDKAIKYGIGVADEVKNGRYQRNRQSRDSLSAPDICLRCVFNGEIVLSRKNNSERTIKSNQHCKVKNNRY